MKKVLFAVFITGILLFACFIPVIKKSETRIQASIIDVSTQLDKAEKWKLWHMPLKQAYKARPSDYVVTNDYAWHSFSIKTAELSYNVSNPSAGDFDIKISNKNNTSQCRLRLSVLSETSSTLVTTEIKTPLINVLFNPGKQDQIVENLKGFMETPALYYSFPIRVAGVVDTNVAVLKKTVTLNNKFSVLPRLLQDLKNYANANDLTVMQPPMLQFQQQRKDSLDIVMMLSVNKPGPDKSNIKCAKMPVRGRMLIGRFRGKFADRMQLNSALEKYIFDKNLEIVVSSYEKYYSFPLPTHEMSDVDLEIYYPIL
jgi:effector-binding domain-containing protein